MEGFLAFLGGILGGDIGADVSVDERECLGLWSEFAVSAKHSLHEVLVVEL